jgi:hypothetical protein
MQSSELPRHAALVWTWEGKAYSLPLSTQDVLQLARAVNAEGYPQNGVAWALVQRAAWLKTKGIEISLGRLVQQYAQPLNPRWFPEGDLHQKQVAGLVATGKLDEAKAENRAADTRKTKAGASWADLSPSTHEVIREVLSGKDASPVVGAVHYWATRGDDFSTNQVRRPDLILLDRGFGYQKTNVFFAVPGSQHFGGVAVINGNESFPPDGNLVMAGMGSGPIIAGLAVYFAWKWLS